MSWTKRQILDEAFTELGIGNAFDVSPEEQQTAIRRLDTMMATWEGLGIRLGYAMSNTPDEGDLDDDSGLPVGAVETVYLNLAKRLAPQFGKQLNMATLSAAAAGYSTLLRAAAQPIEQQLRAGLPLGAGNKGWRTPGQVFVTPPTSDPLGITQGGDLNVLPE